MCAKRADRCAKLHVSVVQQHALRARNQPCLRSNKSTPSMAGGYDKPEQLLSQSMQRPGLKALLADIDAVGCHRSLSRSPARWRRSITGPELLRACAATPRRLHRMGAADRYRPCRPNGTGGVISFRSGNRTVRSRHRPAFPLLAMRRTARSFRQLGFRRYWWRCKHR